MRFKFTYKLIDGFPHLYIFDTEAHREVVEVLEAPYDQRKPEDRLNPEAWRPGPLAKSIMGALQD